MGTECRINIQAGEEELFITRISGIAVNMPLNVIRI